MAKIFTQYALIIILLAPVGLMAQDKTDISSTASAYDNSSVNISQWEARANIRSADLYYSNTTDIDKNKKVDENKSGSVNSLSVSGSPIASKPLVVKVESGAQTLYKNTTNKAPGKDIAHQITDVSQIKDKILLAFFEYEDK